MKNIKKISLFIALCFFINFSFAYNVGTPQSIVTALNTIYDKALKKEEGQAQNSYFMNEVERLLEQIQNKGLQKQAKAAWDIVSSGDNDSGSDDLSGVFERLLDGEDLSDFENNVVVTHLYEHFDNLADPKTNDMAQDLAAGDVPSSYQRISIVPEIDRLKIEDFNQSTKGGACKLYSFIYTVIRTPYLRRQLGRRIWKDKQGNYYFKAKKRLEVEGKMRTVRQHYIVTPAMLKNLKKDMHPSSSPLLQAIGLYANKRFVEEFGSRVPFENYILAIDGRDIFFDRPVINSNGKKDEKRYIKFLKNGDFVVGGKRFEGNFVVSIGTSLGFGGHAVAAFFNKKKKKWTIFDNQGTHLVDVNVIQGQSYEVIGYFKKSLRK